MESVAVRVPATVANLGPGIDTLGLAIGLHLDVEARRAARWTVDTAGEGAASIPTDGSNLVVRAMIRAGEASGRATSPCAVRIRNRIPLGAGLGSSAAAVVAGLLAADALSGAGTPPARLELAAALEGHPDNVAPALLGGFVVAYRVSDGGLRAVRLELTDRLVPILAVPAQGFSTREARRALPRSVPFADARFNVARAGLLAVALSGASSPAILADAMEDRLHQPHRLARMPDTAALLRDLRREGLAVALAGAGPSLLAVVPASDERACLELIRTRCAVAPGGFRVWSSVWELRGAATAPVAPAIDRPDLAPPVDCAARHIHRGTSSGFT